MLRLTLKFKVTISEIIGTRQFSEVKNYILTDDYESSVSIEEIISSSTKVIETKVKELLDTTKKIDISCVSIIPENAVDSSSIIEEPAHIDESADSFDGAMNPPVAAENVVDEIPEGFKESEEIEESPFTNTYFDNDKKEEIKEDSTVNYNYDEMFEKFLKLNFLTRQNLLIKEFNLLPEEHRGDRHKVAFPIAVEVAKKNNLLDKFYEAINSKSNAQG